MSEKKSQIKSKERVADFGEVFTAEREVNAMLDLVKQETERIDSRFLEPACGDGAFLIKILERKMDVVEKQYGKNQSDYERNAILVLTSLYGIDLMEDNTQQCRDHLFSKWDSIYTGKFKANTRQEIRDAAKYVLDKNILCGNALTLKKVDGNQNDLEDPIVFAEWNIVLGDKIKRRDFRLDVLLKAEEKTTETFSLFDDSPMGINNWMTDPETNEIVPAPIKEYPIVEYWRITEYGN